MSDTSKVKQRVRKKRGEDDKGGPPEKDEATKTEYAIAKWMRKNVPIKKTKFLNHTVEYFTANKAIDALLQDTSPWTKPTSKKKSEEEPALFTSRESVVGVLENMLRHKFFHRARKIAVSENELKKKGKKTDAPPPTAAAAVEEEKKVEEDAVTPPVADEEETSGGGADRKKKNKKKKEEVEKKRRKIRLDMHLEQRFVDSSDAYVWIYEPTPYYNYIFGFLVVVAVIAVCLFPLWPSTVRQGVYYLSLAAAGFLVFILALTVLRMVVFGLVWAVTFGKHHLWFLPNLTEDVGFMASFWPLYKYEYKPGDGATDKKNSSSTALTNDASEEEDATAETAKASEESSSEGSQPSQTGKDFEIVEREDAEDNE